MQYDIGICSTIAGIERFETESHHIDVRSACPTTSTRRNFYLLHEGIFQDVAIAHIVCKYIPICHHASYF